MSVRIVRAVREAISGSAIPSTQTRVRRPSPRSSPIGSSAKMRSARAYFPCPRKTMGTAISGLRVEHLAERGADVVDVLVLQLDEERECQRRAADPLRHRQHPLPHPPAPVLGLQVDGGQVRACRYALRCNRLDHRCAVDVLGQPYVVDEPAAGMAPLVRQLDALDAGQLLPIAAG